MNRRSYWRRTSPKSSLTAVMRRHGDTGTEGRQPRDDRGRDRSEASTSQASLVTAELKRKEWSRISPGAFREIAVLPTN